MEIRDQERQFSKEIGDILYKNRILLPRSCFDIKLSSDNEDKNLSYDMIFGNTQVSVRIRTYSYFKYDDMTIRCKSKKNRPTEITKLSNGMGQIYFYGWMNVEETKILKWYLVDIDKIRNKLFTNGILKKNIDGTEFKAYSIDFLKENDAWIRGKVHNDYKKNRL